jgi:hypothetical protein
MGVAGCGCSGHIAKVGNGHNSQTIQRKERNEQKISTIPIGLDTNDFFAFQYIFLFKPLRNRHPEIL